ncbi:hypothetical protein ACFFLZ_12550 [Photobacterium aphoticum]|nr:hypothetical protein [Photobacterium aphoticum]PSU57743.1 hypothetical protein C9I90_08790 [Photobacterium aphoticum]
MKMRSGLNELVSGVGVCAVLSLGVAPVAVAAETPDYGYSYLTMGVENITYQEAFLGSGGAVSDVTTSSPVLNTGGLYYVNDKFDFSIDALATFTPLGATERWEDNQGKAYQQNQFEYLRTSTNILVHYKWRDDVRVVFGPSLTYQTYKRYGLKGLNGYQNPVFREGDTWEEKSTDIFMDAGIAYDSGTLFNAEKWRVSGRWIAGIPIWSVTENTKFENVSFDDFGFRTSLEATLSYEVMKGLHLGWFVMLGYEFRAESDPQTVSFIDSEGEWQQGTAWLPEAKTYTFNTGIQALWKF